MSRLLPDWDRDDQFHFSNSAYRLSFFTFWFSLVIVWFLGGLILLPPLLQAETNADGLMSYVFATVLLFLVTGLIKKVFEGFLLNLMKSVLREKPHIRRANVPQNLFIGVFGLAIFGMMMFGSTPNRILLVDLSTEVLLDSDSSGQSPAKIVHSVGATVVYSSTTFLGTASVIRCLSVLYYRVIVRG